MSAGGGWSLGLGGRGGTRVPVGDPKPRFPWTGQDAPGMCRAVLLTMMGPRAGAAFMVMAEQVLVASSFGCVKSSLTHSFLCLGTFALLFPIPVPVQYGLSKD